MRAKDMNEDFVYTEEDEDLSGAIRCGCISLVGFVAAVLLAAIVLMLFTGCKHVEYVPQVRTEHHWHTDTLERVDSVIDYQQTIIREVDSATMAQFGIQLKSAERAWLIQNDRLQREIDRLRQTTQQADTIRDSIPVPYPVEVVKEVAKEPSLFIKLLSGIGWLSLTILFCVAVIKLKKYLPGGM